MIEALTVVCHQGYPAAKLFILVHQVSDLLHQLFLAHADKMGADRCRIKVVMPLPAQSSGSAGQTFGHVRAMKWGRAAAPVVNIAKGSIAPL